MDGNKSNEKNNIPTTSTSRSNSNSTLTNSAQKPNLSIERSIHGVVFSITALVSFLAYFTTVSPSVAGGDSGELLAEGCQLGTAHPPGYPLYVILVYIATHVGRYFFPTSFSYREGDDYYIGTQTTDAFYVNVTSCVFGAVASGLLSSSILYLIEEKDTFKMKVVSASTVPTSKWSVTNKGSPLGSRFGIVYSCSNRSNAVKNSTPKRKNRGSKKKEMSAKSTPACSRSKQFERKDQEVRNAKDAALSEFSSFTNPLSLFNRLNSRNPPWAKNPPQCTLEDEKRGSEFGNSTNKQRHSKNIKAKDKYKNKDKDNVVDDRKKNRTMTIITHAAIAISVGLMNTISPLMWQYSITAEVFALNNLCVALILHTTIRFAMNPSMGLLRLGAFVCGLALTNQHTSILLSFPLIVWVIYASRLYMPSRWTVIMDNGKLCHVMIQAALSFLSSIILLYATLPLYAVLFPHKGSWGDVTSLTGFIRHLRRADYGTTQLFSGNDTDTEGLVERMILWGKDYAFDQTLPFVACFSLLGCAVTILREKERRDFERKLSRFQSARKSASRRRREDDNECHHFVLTLEGASIDVAIFYALVFYLLVFHTLSNLPLSNALYFGIHQRFWMHPNMLAHIFTGIGISHAVQGIRKYFPTISCIFAILFPIVVIFNPLRNGLAINDQSTNYHFASYASSILKTLPLNSLLFINYDQQWTSVRYIQECESLRRDVTSINLSMMTYQWWETKHNLYPNMEFPGTHLGQNGSGGFTFLDLLDSNIERFDIFLGGQLPYNELASSQKYEEIPHGIVRKIVRKSNKVDHVETFRRKSSSTWKIVLDEYSRGLPDESKYQEDSWESTIRREMYDHYVSRATHLLDLTVSRIQKASLGDNLNLLSSLAEASVWLELARLNDDVTAASPGILKNAGLAYMYMVRSKENVLPSVEDLLNGNRINDVMPKSFKEIWWDGDGDWKTWASGRWLECWSQFLEMETASFDPSYDAVKSIYDTVITATYSK